MRPLSPEHIAELRAQTDWVVEIDPLFTVEVIDAQGELIAKVEKRLYVRRKSR